MTASPDFVVIPKGEYTVNTKHGTVTIIAERDLTLERFARAFDPLFERSSDETARKSETYKKSAPHHSPK